MATAIHSEIKKLAGGNPAAYLSIEFLQALTVKTMLDVIQHIIDAEIPVGQRLLSASLESATFAKPPIGAARLIKYKDALPNQIGLALNSDLTAVVKVFIKGDAKKLISKVTVVVTDIMLLGSYSTNTISFEGADFVPHPTVLRDAAADKLLKDAGIDPLEASRVEGVIAYSSVNSCLRYSLAQRKEISLSEVFPAFDFGAAAQLVPIDSGMYLGIIPSALTRVETAACKCGPGPDLAVSPSSNTIKVPPNPKAGTPLGGVKIGGPLPQKIDPLKDLGRRYQGDGKAGVYLPKAAYSALTVQAMPAISIHASDNGFIGFDAYATVGFSNFNVSLDAAKGGIILSVDMQISLQVICTLDLGCGIRAPIGYAIVQPAAGSHANLKMGFYPSLDGGTVKLKAILEDVDMGTYVAVIIGIGTALEIIGVTAWIGFLIDVVLSAVVSYKLPIVLRDEVKKYLGQNEWVLLRFGDIIHSAYGTPGFNLAATFDVDVDTMLASINLDR